LKSNVSDCLELLECIYKDATSKCTADVSDKRDLLTIRSRVEHEGLSFLTITLPKFCDDFQQSIADGRIDSTRFREFAKCGAIPAFLQGMLSQMFDYETGEMYDNESLVGEDKTSHDCCADDWPTIVESVRQVCLTFKRVELSCTPEREQAALARFVQTEQSFESFTLLEDDLRGFRDLSFMLWSDLVRAFTLTDAIPRHGPGATAERVSGNQKYNWQFWFDRLEPYFPLIDNGFPLGTPCDGGELDVVAVLTSTEEFPVRVVTVPKTLKAPRTIAIEPACLQYVQQGIRDFFYRRIESHEFTAGHVNFTDQTTNKRLALSSSIDGRYSTIDLSDASDRVPLELVKVMLASNQELLDCVLACRSEMAQMPDGTLVGPLRKFASMGSALCFPIEAMYFFTIVVKALLDEQKLSYTRENILKVSRDVYVYGDDIIVPTTNAVTVLDYLQKYNCKVNVDKTFFTGKFRESCGTDAFAGYEVTPTYLRRMRPKNRRMSKNIISWVSAANSFYLKGYWGTCEYLWKTLTAVCGNLPYTDEDCSGLGRKTYMRGYTSTQVWRNPKESRWNKKLQRLEVMALVPKPVYRTDALEGYGALMKSFLNAKNTQNSAGLTTSVVVPNLLDHSIDPDLPSYVRVCVLKDPFPGSYMHSHFPRLDHNWSKLRAESSTMEQSARRGAVALNHRWVRP